MTSSAPYGTKYKGSPHTIEYRIYSEKNGKIISPWHEIPLFADQEQRVLNMVVEIPRFSTAKLEVRKAGRCVLTST